MKKDKSTNIMLWLTAYITLVSVAAGTLLGRTEDQPFWPIMGIYLLIGIEMAFQEKATESPKRSLGYIATLTITTAMLYFFNVPSGLFLIIFFVISAQAMMMLPGFWGILWILALAGISTVVFIDQNGIREALFLMLIYSGGYLFFGIFGKALNDSTLANQRSQQLYEELQTTHAQLQDSIKRVEELAVTKERNRLAREMHDSIGHRLTVSAVQLEGAQRLAGQDPEKTAEIIGTVRQQVREALAELRQTVTALRQPIEMDLPIEQALARLIESIRLISDLEINLQLDPLPPLSAPHRHIIYRTVQESLTNIQRHADAHSAWIYLSIFENELHLTIKDNGKGLPPNAQSLGYGLRGIQERVAIAGGEIQIGQWASNGAQIQIHLPLSVEASDG